MGVRERQPAPVLRRGLEDDRLRAGRAARLGAARPGRLPDRLGVAVHEDRARLRRVARARPGRGRAAGVQRRPGRAAATRSPRPSRPAARSAARSARRRSPRASRSATPPTASTRSSSPAAPAARSSRSRDDEIRAGIRLLAETTGIFTETAGGVTTAVLAKLAERRGDLRLRAGGRGDHRRGAEDARRGPRGLRDRRDRALAGGVRGVGARRGAARRPPRPGAAR